MSDEQEDKVQFILDSTEFKDGTCDLTLHLTPFRNKAERDIVAGAFVQLLREMSSDVAVRDGLNLAPVSTVSQ